ncbi:hypothetical protein ACTXT7_015496 [Hymenolepis weldensis]
MRDYIPRDDDLQGSTRNAHCDSKYTVWLGTSHRVRTVHAAEFISQGLTAACKEIRLSKQLCVPVKYDLKRGFSVGGLVYARTYRPDRQWTAAMTKRRHSGNIYDVETLDSRSQSPQPKKF